MVQILVTGMAALDFVFQLSEFPMHAKKYRAEDTSIVGGGCAANAAVAVVRLGGNARIVTRLGDDPVGDLIAAGLDAEGVDLSLSRRIAGARSAFSSVYVDDAGERQVVNFGGSGFSDAAAFRDAAAGSDAYLADTRWTAGALLTFAFARARGVPAVLDAEPPVDMEAARAATHVAFSRDGLRDFTGQEDLAESLKTARRLTQTWVCVTDGSSGVFYLDDDRMRQISAFDVVVRDTLGAGDVWHGAFALALGEGANEVEAMRFANGAASLTCRSFGGRTGIPSRGELDDCLKDRNPCN
jgi:sulfofructose kinase